MSIRVSKNRIRATGADANSLFIAFCSDDALVERDLNPTGSDAFQRLVKEALSARGFVNAGEGI